MAVYKAGNQIGKLYKGDVQIGKVYKGGTLIYQTQSDTLTVTATHQYAGQVATSNKITNTDGYSKMVIESVSASGGNYGENWAKLYVNGTCVKDTGFKGTGGDLVTAVQSWKGSFNISKNGQVYVQAYTKENPDIDDFGGGISVTVKFHFE